ncbi:hypothetical protein ACXET9_03695 [Brachybacterium sp. DNPG3]
MALSQILLITAVGAGVLFVIAVIQNGPDAPLSVTLLDRIAELGGPVEGELMGALGVVMTVQLACLIAIVSGQIVHGDRMEESKLRGTLDSFSLAAIVMVTPAIFASIVHVAVEADDGGNLLIVLPVYALQVWVGIIIGTFELGDDETLRSFAQQRVRAAEALLHRLEVLPRGTILQAVPLAAGVLAVPVAIGLGVSLLVGGRALRFGADGLATAALFLVLALVLSMVVQVLVHVGITSSFQREGHVAVVVLVAMNAAVYVSCAVIATEYAWPFALLLVLLAPLVVLALVDSIAHARWARGTGRRANRQLRPLAALDRAATARALASVRRTRDHAQRSVDGYTHRITRRLAEEAQGADGKDAERDLS